MPKPVKVTKEEALASVDAFIAKGEAFCAVDPSTGRQRGTAPVPDALDVRGVTGVPEALADAVDEAVAVLHSTPDKDGRNARERGVAVIAALKKARDA